MLQSKMVKKYDTYKDSGIEWIGKIPHEWNVLPHKYIMSKVKNICEKYDGEDIISLTMKGVIKRDLDNPMGKMPLTFDGYQRIETGNLLLCLFDIDVTPRCVGLIKDDGLTSPAYSQFKFLGQDCPQYYTYLLTMIDDDKCFLHLAKNLRSSLTEDNFGAILTIQPPLEEQQKIAEYLDKKCGEIDRVIETEKLVIEKLKEYKQSIITEAVTKGLDKNTQFKDSSIEYIGNIPSNWNIKRLRYFATCQNGISKGGEFFGDGSPFVSYGDVYNNNVLPEVVEGLCMVTDTEKENYSVREGDIFFTRTSETIEEIAITCVCKKTIENATFAGFLIRVRPYIDELVVGYSKYYFASEIHRKFFVKEMNLVTRASLSQELLKKLPVLIPPKDEQQQIAKYLDKKCSEIDKAIANKEQVIEKFTEYKKSLIYECVTGKKRVA